jgi:hypothetical protein
VIDGVEDLKWWLQLDGKTHPESMYWIPKYILLCGQWSISSLGPMSTTMQRAAESQDKVGWWEFKEGRISVKLVSIQKLHCIASPCMMKGDDWMHHFISHILQLSRSQWTFRNITLHDKCRCTLILQERQ